MASRDFISTSDQSFTTATNYTGGVVPIAADDLTFSLSSAVSMNGSDQNTINLASIAVGPSYAGDIGSSAAYLIISADDVSIVGGSNMGSIYLDSGATDNLDEITIDSASTSKRVSLKGTIGPLIVKHGLVTLVSGTITNLYVEWDGTGTAPNIVNEGATVAAFHGGTGFTGSQSGGTITTFNADAGTMTVDGGTVGSYNLRGSARVIHNTDLTNTMIEVWNGANFDASQDIRAKTFSSVNLHQGGTANFDTGLPNNTITAQKEYGNSQIQLSS